MFVTFILFLGVILFIFCTFSLSMICGVAFNSFCRDFRLVIFGVLDFLYIIFTLIYIIVSKYILFSNSYNFGSNFLCAIYLGTREKSNCSTYQTPSHVTIYDSHRVLPLYTMLGIDSLTLVSMHLDFAFFACLRL